MCSPHEHDADLARRSGKPAILAVSHHPAIMLRPRADEVIE
jgi:hypothetical protein